MKQLTLLDQNQKLQTLHILLNNKYNELKTEEIFDVKKYSKFIGVTFSISPKFMNQYLSKFEQLEIVVGIPDERIQDGANMMAKNIKSMIKENLENKKVKLYQELSLESKQKLSEKKITIKVPIGYSIHSKFYLLENEDSSETRIILGSANLSERAFSNAIPQFENVIIYDNNPLYHLYKQYYAETLTPILSDYFPKELLKINTQKSKGQKNESNEKYEDEIVILDNKDIEEIQLKSTTSLFEEVKGRIHLGVLPEKVTEELKDIDQDRRKEKDEEKKESESEELAYQIVKESINTRSKKPIIKSATTISKNIKKKIETVKVKVQDTGFQREGLFTNPDLRNMSLDKSGLFVENKINENRLAPFGRKADNSEIKSALLLIHRFMATFEKYVFKYDDEYGQRIYEALLYSFTGPFLHEIKRKSRTNEERNDIPHFLFIGGTGGSGKSSLLKMLSKMIGIDSKPYWDFSKLGEGRTAKSERVNRLRGWLFEENINPLFVDELSVDFFTNNSYGRDLILEITNSQVDYVTPFPVLVGTSNSDDYNLPHEARRRMGIYYIKSFLLDPDHIFMSLQMSSIYRVSIIRLTM